MFQNSSSSWKGGLDCCGLFVLSEINYKYKNRKNIPSLLSNHDSLNLVWMPQRFTDNVHNYYLTLTFPGWIVP